MENKKYIVLDDDPTGIQTVHDVYMITQTDKVSIEKAFLQSQNLFYILTNSRAFSKEYTIQYHKELIQNIIDVAKKIDMDFTIVSRSDSTLRGHYPTETQVIYDVLKKNHMHIDGEILCPYLDGIRKTENDIHYVLVNDTWVPVGNTEFAKDKTFAFQSSDLKEYVEEKTNKAYLASSCISLSLSDLQDESIVISKLNSVSEFRKVILNCTCMEDLKRFVSAYEKANKRYIFRCAASLVKELGHITDSSYLEKEECINDGSGGLVLVGSHVNKTKEQLEYLKENYRNLEWVEFNQHEILNGTLEKETYRCANIVNDLLKKNKLVVLATRRDRVDFPSDDKEKQLEMATQISFALTNVLKQLTQRPGFLITKGGITSSDALTNGLDVKMAYVLGQIEQNVGVIRSVDDCKFEDLPVVIFPGNVGDKTTLYSVVKKLT